MSSKYVQCCILLSLLALAGCSSVFSSSPTPTPVDTPTPAPLGPPPEAAPGLYMGTSDNALVALDLSDGAQRWKRPNTLEYYSAVVLDHNVLYLVRSEERRVGKECR